MITGASLSLRSLGIWSTFSVLIAHFSFSFTFFFNTNVHLDQWQRVVFVAHTLDKSLINDMLAWKNEFAEEMERKMMYHVKSRKSSDLEMIGDMSNVL